MSSSSKGSYERHGSEAKRERERGQGREGKGERGRERGRERERGRGKRERDVPLLALGADQGHSRQPGHDRFASGSDEQGKKTCESCPVAGRWVGRSFLGIEFKACGSQVATRASEPREAPVEVRKPEGHVGGGKQKVRDAWDDYWVENQ